MDAVLGGHAAPGGSSTGNLPYGLLARPLPLAIAGDHCGLSATCSKECNLKVISYIAPDRPLLRVYMRSTT